jgi:general secretion pathway protein G
MMRRDAGFTRFEFAVCAALSAALAGMLLLKIAQYHAQMERAAAMQVVAAARTAMAVRIARVTGRAEAGSLEAIARENPLSWLARMPENYQGEYYRPHPGLIKPGHWYFDRADKSINFLLSSDTFSPGTSNLLKFKVELSREPDPNRSGGRREATRGLILAQVTGRTGSTHH